MDIESPRGGIGGERIETLRAQEAEIYRRARPKTEAALYRGMQGFLGGVPMHWMQDWPMPFPILVEQAQGATITDIDGTGLTISALATPGRCSAIRRRRSPARLNGRRPAA